MRHSVVLLRRNREGGRWRFVSDDNRQPGGGRGQRKRGPEGRSLKVDRLGACLTWPLEQTD